MLKAVRQHDRCASSLATDDRAGFRKQTISFTRKACIAAARHQVTPTGRSNSHLATFSPRTESRHTTCEIGTCASSSYPAAPVPASSRLPASSRGRAVSFHVPHGRSSPRCAPCAQRPPRADATATDTVAPNLRVAFYYGTTPPVELARYDIAVILERCRFDMASKWRCQHGPRPVRACDLAGPLHDRSTYKQHFFLPGRTLPPVVMGYRSYLTGILINRPSGCPFGSR